MDYVILFIAGAVLGAGTLAILYLGRYANLQRDRATVQRDLAEVARTLERAKAEAAASAQRATELENEARQRAEYLTEAADADAAASARQAIEVNNKARLLNESLAAFEARRVTYDDLLRENNGLKQDLFNFSVQIKKTDRDHAAILERQAEVTRLVNDLASRYLDENVSWIAGKLTSNNYASSKQRLLKVVEACRGIGFDIPQEREQQLLQDLQSGYEKAVRDEFNREEQARIRAQIREEERFAHEIEKQRQDVQREAAAIQAALEKARAELLADARDEVRQEHEAEIEGLEARLSAAKEKERAISQAQLTKSGNVYVLSNIGSFGEGVFKVGMTRRLDPEERVRELSGAAVPFGFQVHMMIPCKDAPALENALHRSLHRQRVNKANLRKEFFRADIESIRKIVLDQHGEVTYYNPEPEAPEYRQSVEMPEEDSEFIEKTWHSVVGESNGNDVDE